MNRNDADETQESPAKQAKVAKVAKEQRETVLWPASLNGGQNRNPANPSRFAPFGSFAGMKAALQTLKARINPFALAAPAEGNSKGIEAIRRGRDA